MSFVDSTASLLSRGSQQVSGAINWLVSRARVGTAVTVRRHRRRTSRTNTSSTSTQDTQRTSVATSTATATGAHDRTAGPRMFDCSFGWGLLSFLKIWVLVGVFGIAHASAPWVAKWALSVVCSLSLTCYARLCLRSAQFCLVCSRLSLFVFVLAANHIISSDLAHCGCCCGVWRARRLLSPLFLCGTPRPVIWHMPLKRLRCVSPAPQRLWWWWKLCDRAIIARNVLQLRSFELAAADICLA